MDAQAGWERFRQYLIHDEELGFTLDVSRMHFDEAWLDRMEGEHHDALDAMEALEGGAIANPDEKRMVGHYWLRAPERAPSSHISAAVTETLSRIESFARWVHEGEVRGERGELFSDILLIGIGGSALGPQLVADALGTPDDLMRVHFLDNTDPDGIARTLAGLNGRLDRTLAIVISKSGGTPETRNGMLEAEAAWRWAGLSFDRHAVAVTSDGSRLFRIAREGRWLATFPMWDWVGGRTSVTSAVGLLPAALQGIDIRELLEGARRMDQLTLRREMRRNPAAMLALMWHWAGDGQGRRDMVVLPYKDRLLLMSRYLQQLVMESLGKEHDLEGRQVFQGLSVFGNKGSTDQHAYVQQLRDGLANFFVTFIEVLADNAGSGASELELEPRTQSGDYLQGFMLGTRAALAERDRDSMTITIRKLDARSLGMLIALFERAVGLYAALVHINAYHQPGVEAGKKAAREVLDVQVAILEAMERERGKARNADGWALVLGRTKDAETIYKLLERFSANPSRGVVREPAPEPWLNKYRMP